MKWGPWTDAEGRPFRTNGLHDRADYLEREAHTIVHRSPIFIGPFVRHRLQKLVQEVAVSPVYLHPIEAGFNSIARCLGVQLNVFFNLRNRKFAWNIVVRGDGTRCNEIKATFLLEDGRIGSAPKSPKLEEYVRAVGVDRIRDLRCLSQGKK